ncbi:MAG: amidohydrolase family protein [Cyanobacteria bacterium SZAS-4]|nr:amidohydrolase family protein [Cyanobacteria bacterium SZAS-4]
MRKFWLTTLLSMLCASSAQADSLLLQNANVVDPKFKTIQKRDILILDGRITAQKTNVEKKYRTIDLAGKYIIPGLIDLHVHCGGNPFPDGTYEDLGPEPTAKAMLYSGVVAYLDLFYGDFAQIFRARNLQQTEPSKHRDEADIYCAGTGWGNWNLTKDPQAAVESYIDRWKPDVIKLIYGRDSLDKVNLAKAIKGATKKGVKTVVHIGSWEHGQDAIESGATAVTHFFDDEVIPNEVLKVWAKSKAVSIPTLAAQCDLANLTSKPLLLKSKILDGLEPASRLATYLHKDKFTKKTLSVLKWQKEDTQNDMKSLKKLADAHVQILAGSDTGNPGTIQGFSLHREIKLMQDAGYSTWDALASATTKAAAFLGRPSGIKDGDFAELVVLDANPIQDIANTQRIHNVIHHGNIIDRSALVAPK